MKTLIADQGLLISWTQTADRTTVRGYQVLCAPGPSSPATAAYDICGAAPPDGGAGPFAAFDPQFVCSELVAVGTNSVRVHGLENGRTYQMAVVAVGVDGTPSAPSEIVDGTPGPTVGFEDLYKLGEARPPPGAPRGDWRTRRGRRRRVIAGALLIAFAARRRSRRGPLAIVVGAGLALAGAAARADTPGDNQPFTARADWATAPPPSSRSWNVELRFAPYRPNVDDEFADRGSPVRPFAEIFGTSRRLMSQLEIDRHVLHRGGTWAIGAAVGYYRVDRRLAVGRPADPHRRRDVAAVDPALRRARLPRGHAARPPRLAGRSLREGRPRLHALADGRHRESDSSGRTFGWHAAAGVTLDLSFLDPEAAHSMDREAGVNQTALFFEVVRYDLYAASAPAPPCASATPPGSRA